jgi:glutamate/tyrosine decarboxylase-like PLP-dependent enzyme
VTIDRAARILGFGTGALVPVAVDGGGRMEPAVLRAALAAAEGPAIVCAQAGDVNSGAFDPLAEVVEVSHDAGAWVHVDGAFGLWAAASPRHRGLLDGYAGADSWATDGHKWLNVPYDCGYAFVAHPEHHRAAMEHHASYLIHADDVRDQLDWNPEHSRRARGFTTYAALRELGRSGLADLIARCCRQAHDIVTRIGALPNARAIWVSQINQGLVRFYHAGPGATEEDHDKRTDEVMSAINASGEAFFTGTTWRGKRCMRVSVSSWRTTEDDVDRAVAAAERA